MRFHFGIGFSKKVKTSILFWLGLLFLIFSTIAIGSLQQVYASEVSYNTDLSSYFGTTTAYGYTKATSDWNTNQPTSYTNTYTGINSSNLRSFGWQYIFGTYSWNSFFTRIETPINTNMCSGVQDTNSIDLYGRLKGKSLSTLNSMISLANLTTANSLNDIFSIYIEPTFSNANEEDVPVQYACHISDEVLDSGVNYYYDFVCESIPTENVLGYKLIVINNIYASNSGNPNNLFFRPWSSDNGSPQSPYGLYKYFDYQCSYVEPTPPDNPLFPEDATGSSSVTTEGSSGGHCFGEGCASSNVNQSDLYIDWYNDADISESLTNLIKLPFNIVNVIVNSSGDTCIPISIDFSSITHTWGNSNYVLQLPCMRTTLSTLLNYQIIGTITIYNLFDMLIGFGLCIVFVNRFLAVINNILSGDSMSEFLDMR